MDRIMVWLETTLGLSAGTVTKLLITLTIVLVLWLVRWGIVRFLNHRTDRPELRYRWRKVTTYSVMILGLLLVGRVWLEGIQSLVTYFGLLSAGIAIALRDPIVNWFGWIFIGWRRPFLVGDRIQVGPISGDVIDIGVSTFSLLEVADPHDGEQATGRIVHMPNGKVFTEPLINLTQGFKYVWNEIPITVTFESDWETAKEILTRVVHGKVEVGSEEAQQWIRDATRQFLIRTPDVAPAVFTRIVPDGVELTVRYMCHARMRRSSEQAISEAVLTAFRDEPTIDFAYRTSRLVRQTEEGKPDLRRRARGEDGE